MSVLTRRQKKRIDRLFWNERKLRTATKEFRIAVSSDAEHSADPTARQAVANLSELSPLLECEHPELWLHVMDLTWERYSSSHQIGKAMRRRYVSHESVETIAIMEYTTTRNIFKWRDEFLIYAAMMALKNGLTI